MNDMGITWAQGEKFAYSFHNADRIVDFLQSINLQPFGELSFMPRSLASGSQTVFHYQGNVASPRQNKDWRKLISTLLTHWKAASGGTQTLKLTLPPQSVAAIILEFANDK
jgi:xylan 1,4-beta-xylosidase